MISMAGMTSRRPIDLLRIMVATVPLLSRGTLDWGE